MAELKTSPLHERHVALGAKFAEFGGWSMPLQYSSIVAEHKAVRDAVGIFDVSHLGKASVTGAGAADFVNACFTNDLGKIGPGQAQYTLCCAEDGGVVDDLIAYLVSDDEVFLIPNAANTAEVVAPADRGGARRHRGHERAPRLRDHRRPGPALRRAAREARRRGRLRLHAVPRGPVDGSRRSSCAAPATPASAATSWSAAPTTSPCSVWDALLAAGADHKHAALRSRRPRHPAHRDGLRPCTAMS